MSVDQSASLIKISSVFFVFLFDTSFLVVSTHTHTPIQSSRVECWCLMARRVCVSLFIHLKKKKKGRRGEWQKEYLEKLVDFCVRVSITRTYLSLSDSSFDKSTKKRLSHFKGRKKKYSFFFFFYHHHPLSQRAP